MSATPSTPGPDEIRSYLLRRLPEQERARFEEAYFTDDGLFDRIEAEEDRLVSDYILDHLSRSDRGRFEESLLKSPYYRERVDTTNRLHRRLVRAPGVLPARPVPLAGRPRRHIELPLFPPGTGKAIVIVILGGLLVAAVLAAFQLKRDVEALKADRLGGGRPIPAAVSAGLVPSIRTVVVEGPSGAGPSFRRITPEEGSPLLIVIPRSSLAPGVRPTRLSLTSQSGETIWESGPIESPLSSTEDLALRLPAGLPPAGFSAVVLWAGSQPVFFSILACDQAPDRR